MKSFYVVLSGVLTLAAAVIIVMLAWPKQQASGQAQKESPAGPSKERLTALGEDAGVISYVSYVAKIRSLDPATAGDTTSASLQGNIYESLYAYHYLKRPVEVIPQLADAMPELSTDQKTYTIKIRKGVKYCPNPCFGTAEGKPKTREVTAHDFVLAFKRIADPHIVTPMSLAFIEDKVVGIKQYWDAAKAYAKGDFSRYDKLQIEGIKAMDDHTLQIRLTVPFPQLIYVLAISNYCPVPREVVGYWLERRGADDDRAEIPLKQRDPRIIDYRAVVGTGPYYITSFKDGGDIILKRNPAFRDDYYPSEGAKEDKEAGLLADAGKKVPFIDTICWEFVREPQDLWTSFKEGNLDVSGIPLEHFKDVIAAKGELKDEWAKKGVRLVKSQEPSVYWYAFNMEDSVVGKSKSLRQALCLGLDVDAYIEVLRNGRGRRARNVVPASFGGEWDVKAQEMAGPSPYAKLDLNLAKKKLEDAKKELVAAGVIKQGEPIPTLHLDLGGTDERTRRAGEAAMKQFKQLGIELKVTPNDWPTLQEKVHNRHCQIFSMGWHADYPDPENFLQLHYGSNIVLGTNNANYSNPDFDRLFEKAVAMQPSKERAELYARMLKILQEDCPVLLLDEPVNYLLVHSWLHNVKPHPIGYGMQKYRRIDEEARKKATAGR